jgi:predicted Rossmann fold nucleotide-binding protein DprA/Smf involved in DNA uptake
MSKIAVIGSRSFNNYIFLKDKIQSYCKDNDIEIKDVTIISGGASGADTCAKNFAKEFGTKYIEFLPDWDKYGKSAGPRRNKLIIDACDFVIAFWDGVSKGTASSIKFAEEQNKKVIVYWEV